MLWRAAVLRIMVLIDLYIDMYVDLHVLLGDQMLLRLLLAAPVQSELLLLMRQPLRLLDLLLLAHYTEALIDLLLARGDVLVQLGRRHHIGGIDPRNQRVIIRLVPQCLALLQRGLALVLPHLQWPVRPRRDVASIRQCGRL